MDSSLYYNQGGVPIARIMQKVDSAFLQKNYLEGERILTYWLEEARVQNDVNSELTLLSELGGVYRNKGDKEGTIGIIGRIKEKLKSLGKLSVGSAVILLNCATCEKSVGQSKIAVADYERVKRIFIDSNYTNSADWGALNNNLGLAYADIGEKDKALESFYSALEHNKNAPNGSIYDAITYQNIADLFYLSGRSTQNVMDALNKAYESFFVAGVERNADYAIIADKCAPAFSKYGLIKEAETLAKIADEIRKNIDG